jgi:hypothetical protein
MTWADVVFSSNQSCPDREKQIATVFSLFSASLDHRAEAQRSRPIRSMVVSELSLSAVHSHAVDPDLGGLTMRTLISVLLMLAALGSVYAAGVSDGTCTEFMKSSLIYTEIAIPCAGSTPDLNSPVAVNQQQPQLQGGECRAVTQSGEFFRVENSQLVFVSSNGGKAKIGTLMGSPSCYQTDRGGEFYASWIRVQIE